MTEPSEVLVFLYREIKEKEDELQTLQVQRDSNAKEARELICLYETAQHDLAKLNNVVPVIKELNDHGG
jgi:hypothetical protein